MSGTGLRGPLKSRKGSRDRGFLAWARRDEGAYPQWSVTEEQRSPSQKAALPGGPKRRRGIAGAGRWVRRASFGPSGGVARSSRINFRYARRSRLSTRPKARSRDPSLLFRRPLGPTERPSSPRGMHCVANLRVVAGFAPFFPRFWVAPVSANGCLRRAHPHRRTRPRSPSITSTSEVAAYGTRGGPASCGRVSHHPGGLGHAPISSKIQVSHSLPSPVNIGQAGLRLRNVSRSDPDERSPTVNPKPETKAERSDTAVGVGDTGANANPLGAAGS
jgi:hypothetical protein